jgi:hypothetical protein
MSLKFFQTDSEALLLRGGDELPIGAQSKGSLGALQSPRCSMGLNFA